MILSLKILQMCKSIIHKYRLFQLPSYRNRSKTNLLSNIALKLLLQLGVLTFKLTELVFQRGNFRFQRLYFTENFFHDISISHVTTVHFRRDQACNNDNGDWKHSCAENWQLKILYKNIRVFPKGNMLLKNQYTTYCMQLGQNAAETSAQWTNLSERREARETTAEEFENGTDNHI